MRNNANQQEAKKYPIVGSEFQEEANCHFQKRLVIEECVYYVHPVYNFYAASRDGQIIHIFKQLPNNGNKQHNGYVQCSVCKYEDKNTKTLNFIDLFGNAFMVLYQITKSLIILMIIGRITVYAIYKL